MKQARRVMLTGVLVSGALVIAATLATGQQAKTPPTPAQSIARTYTSLNERIIAMAEDWPAEKYNFRLDPKANPPTRTFGEVLVHILSGNVYAAKAGLAKLQAYKRRMGWGFPWASSFGSNFNADFNVGFTEEQQRKGGIEYNYRREAAWELRSDEGIASRMPGTQQTGVWWRRHDEYDKR